MAPSAPLVDNAYAGADWVGYAQYRPQYASSAIQLVLDYHRDHGGQYSILHDVGSGNGVFARLLAPYFEHIHISDPDPANIEHARTLVDRPSSASFTFGVAPGEQAHLATSPHSVDMITLAAAAHWTEIDDVVRSAAEALKPGGTLAMLSYQSPPAIVDHPKLRALWATLEGENARNACCAAAVLAGYRKSNTGLDFVPLPEDLYTTELTKRININTNGTGTSGMRFIDDPHLLASSRVRPEEKILEYNLPAKEAMGWRYQVGPGWFEGFLRTLPVGVANMPSYAGRLAEIDALIKKLPHQRVVVEFTVHVLLATRK